MKNKIKAIEKEIDTLKHIKTTCNIYGQDTPVLNAVIITMTRVLYELTGKIINEQRENGND